ncbi:MAG: hypothetical protein JRN20_14825 [Nitrososphaerota archaeon]|nr:hypothetical protein [Nitrososphaerota archaeon]
MLYGETRRNKRKSISEILGALILLVIVVTLSAAVWSAYAPALSSSSGNLSNEANKAAQEQLALLSSPYSYIQGRTANIYVSDYGHEPVTVQASAVNSKAVFNSATVCEFVYGGSCNSVAQISPGGLYDVTVSLQGVPQNNAGYNITLVTDMGPYYFFVAPSN